MHFLDEETLWKEYRKAQHRHCEVCNNASELRFNFLVDLINAQAEANNTNPETKLSNLQGWESQRNIHAKIRSVSGCAARPTLTRLTCEILQPNGAQTIEEAVDPEDLAQFGANEYEKRLHLTEDYDLMKSPMVHLEWYIRPTTWSRSVYHLFSATTVMEMWPRAQRWSSRHVLSHHLITTAQHIEGQKRSKEITAPGLSGLATAHWKAACKTPYLASMDASWANYPYVTRYSPLRWRKGIDIMISKKVLETRVELLRPILLFEVDCNQNNKRLGRTVMQMVESHNGIAPQNNTEVVSITVLQSND
jgi:hypothetical protein